MASDSKMHFGISLENSAKGSFSEDLSSCLREAMHKLADPEESSVLQRIVPSEPEVRELYTLD